MSNIKVKNGSVILSEKIVRPSSFFYYFSAVVFGLVSATLFIVFALWPWLVLSTIVFVLGGTLSVLESGEPLDQGKKFFKTKKEKYNLHLIYEQYIGNETYRKAVEDFAAEYQLLGNNFVEGPWLKIFRELNTVMQDIEKEEKVKTEKIDRPDYARQAKDAHDFYQGRIIK